MRTLPLSRRNLTKIWPREVPTELHWGTLLLSQAGDRAPLESDPSADLGGRDEVGSHTSRLSLAG